MTAPEELRELVRRFSENRDVYVRQGYNETQLRREFIDPFFRLLGWDVDNTAGYAEPYKDVVHEDSIKVAGEPKAPDYCFRIGGTRKFFVEAKRPGIDITRDTAPAFQLRRYGWSSKLSVSVLTNFDAFAVYDGRIEPGARDSPSVARVLLVRVGEYLDRWDEIQSILARESILRGAFDRFASSNRLKRGTATVDRSFLGELDRWRESLARNLALRNPSLTVEELNFAVQQTIDRIVFLRMAEDRGTEAYGQLKGLLATTKVYEGLVRRFVAADQRYNSGLFHFTRERGRSTTHDGLSLSLTIDDKPLKDILRRLYYPESPYEFSAIPAEILGHVYEQFLGKVIRLDTQHRATIEARPEVRKAGGVFYTPPDIVQEILRLTLARWLEGRTVEDARLGGPRRGRRLTILDPACGSGSFLIAAYQHLLNWYLLGYSAEEDRWLRGRDPRLVRSAAGALRLSTGERKRILLDHIYGVDIDSQAVEVTKLSLLLKVLEGETSETLQAQLSFFQQRALPDLDGNVQCGNSLIDTDIFRGGDAEAARALNPYSWTSGFPTIVPRSGFDLVIGNPPWLMAGYYVSDQGLAYLRDRYASAVGKFDLYYAFLEKSVDLVAADGAVGMIVPNKFLHTRSAKELRRLLSDRQLVERLVDFGDVQVFDNATNYSAIVVLNARPRTSFTFASVTRELGVLSEFEVSTSAISEQPWQLQDPLETAIFDRMRTVSSPLESLVDRFGTGMQTGADRVYVLTANAADAAALDDEGLLRPLRRGRDVRRYLASEPDRLVVFPYKDTPAGWQILSESALDKYPRTAAWLRKSRAALDGRVWFGKTAAELSGEWFGLMYLDDRQWFDRPHILTPSLSPRSNFARGDGRLFVTGTAGVTSIVPIARGPEDIAYLLAILNSKPLSYFAVRHSPIYSGGFYKFSAPYLRHLPIPRLPETASADVGRLLALVPAIESVRSAQVRARTARQEDSLAREVDELEHELDEIAFRLYGLDEEQVAYIEARLAVGREAESEALEDVLTDE